MVILKKDNRPHLPSVLITGCASGIGLELAKLLYADQGYRVAVTARGPHLEGLLNEFAESDRFRILELDVTSDSQIYSAVNYICQSWGSLDVLVNNAAICYRGVTEHMDTDAELLQIKTNYLGPMTLIRSVLPIMREQRSGQIINVSSASGSIAMPTMGSYSASKHALEGATEALWYEARPMGIAVNLIEVGFVNSLSYQNVIMAKKAEMSLKLNGPQSEYYRSMVPLIEKFMKRSSTSSLKVAKAIYKTIQERPADLRISASADFTLLNILRTVLPSRYFNRLFYALLPGVPQWGGNWRAPNKTIVGS